jgi:transposase
MGEISTIGLDLAKNVFQVHGADASGAPVLKKKIRRDQVLTFFSELPPCLVAMEACSSAHCWARQIARFGHKTRLIAPAYVKPFVKRQKNDAADAEAICEAALRPTMRFVPVKSAAQQASAIVFRTRDLLVRQRTQIINALRGHLNEQGIVVAKGPSHAAKLLEIIDDGSALVEGSLSPLEILTSMLRTLNEKIEALDAEIVERVKSDDDARRIKTIPGIGPVIAAATSALAPPARTFRKGRDFAAWMGLTPRQHASGGKEKLGRTTKMGERSLRRLYIIGANSVIRWAVRNPPEPGTWLARMLATKPRQLVAVALANKMTRIAWALMAHGGDYKASGAKA